MAFFSNQGIAFPQAVGTIFGPGKIPQGQPRAFHEGSLGFMPRLGGLRADQEGSLGSMMRAYRNGSLGDTDCPECPPCPGAEDPMSYSSESGSDRFLAKNTPHAYHDGIFMAPEQTDGTLQAEQNGSLSGGGLGLPLYVNGRLVEDPITIHHGYLSGMGATSAFNADTLPLLLEVNSLDALTDIRNLLVAYLVSPAGKAAGFDASTIPATYMATPSWGPVDMALVGNLVQKLDVPTLQKSGFFPFANYMAGKSNVPTAPLLYWLGSAVNASNPDGFKAVLSSAKTPFFRATLAEVVAGMVGVVPPSPVVNDIIAAMSNTQITWPDGTSTIGDKVAPSGTTPSSTASAAKSTNYLLYGSLLAVAGVATWYLFKK